MSCERFEGERIDVAAGDRPSPALQAHLEACPACRQSLDEQRRALEDVDHVLRTGLSAAPSPEFPARVAARLRETERRRWRPVWVAAMAAAVAVALIAGWIARRPRGEETAGPRQAATSPETRPRADVPRVTPSAPSAGASAPSVTRPRAAAARVTAGTPRRAAATIATEPLVLVPPGQEEALRRFASNLGRGTQPVPPLLIAGTSVEGAVEPPPLLEIAAVSVEPLSHRTVSPERSQR